MMRSTLFLLVGFAASVSSHGGVQSYSVGNNWYKGYLMPQYPTESVLSNSALDTTLTFQLQNKTDSLGWWDVNGFPSIPYLRQTIFPSPVTYPVLQPYLKFQLVPAMPLQQFTIIGSTQSGQCWSGWQIVEGIVPNLTVKMQDGSRLLNVVF